MIVIRSGDPSAVRLRWGVWLLSFGVGLRLLSRRVRRRRMSTKAEEPIDAASPEAAAALGHLNPRTVLLEVAVRTRGPTSGVVVGSLGAGFAFVLQAGGLLEGNCDVLAAI